MGENDRDWTKCQKEVKALKECQLKQASLGKAPKLEK